MENAAPKTALVVGATGLVGRELLQRLCQRRPDYQRVIAWVRQPITYEHPKLQVREILFDQMAAMPLEPVHDIYCALGTTMKKAGSEKAFLRVDVGYPKVLAEWGRRAGAQCFVLLSAPGADPDSPIFYLRAKGLAEQAVRAAGYPSLLIVHPPLIDGLREDFRTTELLGISFFNLFGRVLPQKYDKYQPMSAADIAAAIAQATLHPAPGERVFHPYEATLPPHAEDAD